MQRLLVAIAVLAAAAVFPMTALAQAPTVEFMPTNDVEVFAGADSPCPFDITLTGTGTVKVTTFYDSSGVPVREFVEGALTHTISSAWHTLTTNGPAPVHLDLTTGVTALTGDELLFHVPGDGIVFGQAGRLLSAADGSVISFAGSSVVDTTGLCAALAPSTG